LKLKLCALGWILAIVSREDFIAMNALVGGPVNLADACAGG
jgi:hypothetical protein